MLATLVSKAFSDPAWIYEAKFDGQRCLVFKRGATIRLMTRNEKDRTSHYPDLVPTVSSATEVDMIADGEIVAFDGEQTSFSRLQGRMQNAHPNAATVAAIPVAFYLFDLLWLDGYDLTSMPLTARKDVLRGALTFGGPLLFSAHLEQDGEAAFDAACEKGWEGLIAKRASAPYVHGRSKDWLKFKCVNEQEFVVVGWTDPKGSRSGIGALLMGYHDETGALRFAGKVGTGFDQRELDRLSKQLAPLGRKDTPLAALPAMPQKGIHWVRPVLVAQIGFSEWTGDGKLRHPRYLGLRDDKDASQVIREGPSA